MAKHGFDKKSEDFSIIFLLKRKILYFSGKIRTQNLLP